MSRREALPIGSTHDRDWEVMRQQRPLRELKAGEDGFVRFDCMRCPYRGHIALTTLHAHFSLDEGLVNILNAIAPKTCPHAEPAPSGMRHCGFRYVGLRRGPPPAG